MAQSSPEGIVLGKGSTLVSAEVSINEEKVLDGLTMGQIIPKESLTKITDNGDGTETLSPSDPNFGKIIIPKEEPKSNIERLPFPELVKEFAEYYKDIPLVEEPKQETLEEYIERETKGLIEPNLKAAAKAFIRYGAKWQAEKTCESEFIQLIRATKSDAEARRIIRECLK